MVSHRALEISEIVQNIADFILPSKQSLTAMARTCKAFYEPSMNAIWKEIPHIGILFDCFPENVWLRPSSGLIKLNGDLHDLKTWEKFLRNAARVQVLTHCLPARYDNEVYRLLGFARPEMHLFPQLHTLHFEDKNPEQCRNILLFLSPSLIRLTLRNHHGEAIFKVCEAVAYRARYLKHLDIPNPPFALPTFDSPANEIREFPRLNSLTTLNWTGEIMRLKAFSSLSTLPNLIKLTLNTLHLEPLQDRCSIPHLSFTALQVLTLQVRNFSTMIDPILSSIGAPHLSEVVLTLTQDETLVENNVRSLLSALSTRKKLASITVSASLTSRVRLSVRELLSRYSEDTIDGATLEPLLKVRGLVKLDLSRLACRISDSTLQRLARQWRLMEDLRLGSSCHESMPVASFSGLQAIVTGCPRLKILGIPLDTSPPPSSIFATSQRTASYTCTEYHVLGRDPRDPIRVAALLSDILPAASIHSCATSEGWTLIGKLIKPFAEVRREERQRAEEASRQCSKRSSIFSNFT